MRTLTPSGDVFSFGPFKLIPLKQSLLKDGRQVRLGGRALDLLYLLVSRAGEEVTKNELISFAWPTVCVDDQNLKVNISSIRRALHDSSPQEHYIATVVGHGYQFVAPVHVASGDASANDQPDDSGLRELPLAVNLIGRQTDVERIGQAVRPAKLVTLVGAGGVGKTSLAIVAAHARREDFPDGICFIDLCTTSDHTLVPHIVATGLGVRSEPSDLTAGVLDYLRDRRMLIVLDNCEHVLQAAAAFAARFVAAKTQNCLVVTSRDPLGVATEDLQYVQPLAYPNCAELQHLSDAVTYPSVELFAQRAVETTDYSLVDGDLQIIARICEALDGLPLAIEIAASMLAKISPAELLSSVGKHIGAMSHHADVHSRHRTLWATLDWSYRLLSVNEATMFRLLSVFSGYFDWSDVMGMARLVHLDAFHTMMAVSGLVEKSLLTADGTTDQLRYRYLESSKKFAGEQLRADPIFIEAQRYHAQIVTAAMKSSEADWVALDHRVWRAKYEVRVGDVRKALDWCFSDAGDAAIGIDLTAVANRLWTEQSSMFEKLYQIERALSHESTTVRDAKKTATLAISHAWSTTLARRPGAEADSAWSAALEFAKLSNEAELQLVAFFGWAVFSVYSGLNVKAFELTESAKLLAIASGNEGGRIDAERLGALSEIHLGKLTDARAKLERLAAEVESDAPLSRISRYREQRHVGLYVTLALSRWLTGDAGAAMPIIDDMVQRTAEVRPLTTHFNLLTLVAMPIAMLSDRVDKLEGYLASLGANLQRQNITFWEPVHSFYASFVSHRKGDFDAVEGMASAVSVLVKDGVLTRTPLYMSAVANALLDHGRVSEAEKAAEFALQLSERASEPWCVPELRRVKALLLAATGRRDAATLTLDAALKQAVAMGSKALELKIARDLLSMSFEDDVGGK